MKDRVIGIENEYGALASDPKESDSGTPNVFSADDAFLRLVLEKADRKFGSYIHTRLWLPNGGCAYVDLNKLEWASPECRRVRDVVLYNKAGERVVTTIMRGSRGEKLCDFFKTNVALARKTNAMALYGVEDEEKYVSFGCHENYMTHNMQFPSINVDSYMPLVPFLVTRQVYGGSGWWQDDREDMFWRSQRARFIPSVSSPTTTGTSRGILNEKSESHTTLSGVGRFHLIMGDANMLEYALFLKVGATMLMVALMEEGLLPMWQIKPELMGPEAYGSGAVNAFRNIAKESDLNRKMLLVRREKETQWQCMSPLEVQTAYCELATRYVKTTRFHSEESEHEALQICSMWDETIAALSRGDTAFLTGRIDWYTKQRIASTMIIRSGKRGESCTPDSIRADVDVGYHDVGDDSLYQSLVRRGIATRIVTDEEIIRATTEPPPATEARGTRACLRGKAVTEALLYNADRTMPWPHPSWENVHYPHVENAPSGYRQFPIEDPLAYTSEELDEFLRQCKSSR